MTEENIRQLLEELDAEVSRDNAQLVIYCEDPEGEGSCELIGNRDGFLRAGIELLKAAMVSMKPGDSITPISIDYLIRSGRSLRVKRLTRQESVDAALPPVRRNSWKDKIIGVGCLALVIFFAICGFIGIEQVFTWIVGK